MYCILLHCCELSPFLVHQLFDVAQELPHSHMHNTKITPEKKKQSKQLRIMMTMGRNIVDIYYNQVWFIQIRDPDV